MSPAGGSTRECRWPEPLLFVAVRGMTLLPRRKTDVRRVALCSGPLSPLAGGWRPSLATPVLRSAFVLHCFSPSAWGRTARRSWSTGFHPALLLAVGGAVRWLSCPGSPPATDDDDASRYHASRAAAAAAAPPRRTSTPAAAAATITAPAWSLAANEPPLLLRLLLLALLLVVAARGGGGPAGGCWMVAAECRLIIAPP